MTMFNSTHLCVREHSTVTVRTADGAVYIDLDHSPEHRLTISGKADHVVTLLLKAAAQILEHTEEVPA